MALTLTSVRPSTKALAKLGPAPVVVAADTDAALIVSFYQRAESAAREAHEKRREASWAAMICGRLLLEKRAALKSKGPWQGATKPDAEKFLTWLGEQCPEISRPTAYRYMAVAERVAEKFELPAHVTIENAPAVPLSKVLATEKDELPDEAREIRQMVFDFCVDRTITELISDAVMEPDSAASETRFKRALNGKTTGGAGKKFEKGVSRKDWPKFIGQKFSDVSSHLAKFPKFSALQKDQTFIALDSAVQKWPTAVLEHLQKSIKETLKTR